MNHQVETIIVGGGQAGLAVQELNLKAANITSIIWATGYRFDFSMVQLPIFDEDGYPIQQRGVTAVPGLYFVGLPWLDTMKSGLLMGVGAHAGYLADRAASYGRP
jgi:putative flavoprotein involved in K+ transport